MNEDFAALSPRCTGAAATKRTAVTPTRVEFDTRPQAKWLRLTVWTGDRSGSHVELEVGLGKPPVVGLLPWATDHLATSSNQLFDDVAGDVSAVDVERADLDALFIEIILQDWECPRALERWQV